MQLLLEISNWQRTIHCCYFQIHYEYVSCCYDHFLNRLGGAASSMKRAPFVTVGIFDPFLCYFAWSVSKSSYLLCERKWPDKYTFEKNRGLVLFSSIESIWWRGDLLCLRRLDWLHPFLLPVLAERLHVMRKKSKDKVHPVLIVGWTNTALGEAWKNAKPTHIQQVAFRHKRIIHDMEISFASSLVFRA